jgi:predicted DNA binding CopG/RHH family protein
MREEQAHQFYKAPEHLATAGPGQRRQRPMKTGMIPVRFTPEMIGAVKRFASQDGMTVSTWIRRLVGKEIQRRQPSATASMTMAPAVQLRYPAVLQPRSETASGVDSERLIAIR